MLNNRLIKFGNAYLLFFLALSPWYDAVYVLPGVHFTTPILSYLSTSGIANSLNVSLCLIALGYPLLFSFRRKRPSFLEGAIMIWPLINILHFRVLDVPGVVSLKNSVFLAACFLTLFRSRDVFESYDLVRKWGYHVFAVSFSIAVLVPLLIPLPGREIFLFSGDVQRYRGWSGINSIGFSGVTATAWGMLSFFKKESSKEEKYIASCVMILGLLSIQLAVLRVACFSIMVMMAIGIGFKLVHKNWQHALIISWILGISILSFSSSSLSRKGGFNGGFRAIHWKSMRPNFDWSEKKEQLARILNLKLKKSVIPEGAVAALPSPALTAPLKEARPHTKPIHLPKPVVQPETPPVPLLSAPVIQTQEDRPPAESVPVPEIVIPPETPPAPAAQTMEVRSHAEPVHLPEAVVQPETPQAPAVQTHEDRSPTESVPPPQTQVKVEVLPIPIVEIAEQKSTQRIKREFLADIREYLWRFNGVSNGRVGIMLFLLENMEGHWLVGVGTGGAGRILRAENYLTLEAHNEYLRFFVDHGLLGLLYLLIMGAMVMLRTFKEPTLAVLCGVAILMMTDNYLIYPSFGYGPLFLGLSLWRARWASEQTP